MCERLCVRECVQHCKNFRKTIGQTVKMRVKIKPKRQKQVDTTPQAKAQAILGDLVSKEKNHVCGESNGFLFGSFFSVVTIQSKFLSHV